MGEMFYQANKEKDQGEVDEQYYAVIDLVNKLEQNRRGYYKNKLRLEGQMMCEHCGAVIPYGSMFCNVCGQRADGQAGAGVAPVGAVQTAAVPPMGTRRRQYRLWGRRQHQQSRLWGRRQHQQFHLWRRRQRYISAVSAVRYWKKAVCSVNHAALRCSSG